VRAVQIHFCTCGLSSHICSSVEVWWEKRRGEGRVLTIIKDSWETWLASVRTFVPQLVVHGFANVLDALTYRMQVCACARMRALCVHTQVRGWQASCLHTREGKPQPYPQAYLCSPGRSSIYLDSVIGDSHTCVTQSRVTGPANPHLNG
jgi:hypothetical protein